MLINPRRGEISAVLGGAERRLCLTLGALAQLERDLAAGDLQSLAQRFSSGRVSADDLITILHAGLVGGGNALTREDVADLDCEDGLAGYAAIAAQLLEAAFGPADEA
ncbi:MAG: gene transfer agent family protein [Pseudomonadota bacterium]